VTVAEPPPPASGLVDRRRECEVLEALVDRVRRGRGSVLVVHGEPGIGKTALLDHVARAARGLALRELPRDQSSADLATAGAAGEQPLTARMEGGFRRRLAVLPAPSAPVASSSPAAGRRVTLRSRPPPTSRRRRRRSRGSP
jgi:hypothetical protein